MNLRIILDGTYNDVDYFYVYHLQGDVVALIDANGTQVVEYGYDARGNPISKSGSMVATLGTENLFRYREYVYDEETKLYYNKECGIDGEKSLRSFFLSKTERKPDWLPVPSSIMRKFIYKSGRTPSAQGRETCP